MQIDIHGKSVAEKPVLGPIRLAVAAGERVAILGRSGIGNITFLCKLAGLDRDFEGSVLADGDVGAVFQEPTSLPWRSALAIITLITGADDAAARTLLADAGLAGKRRCFRASCRWASNADWLWHGLLPPGRATC